MKTATLELDTRSRRVVDITEDVADFAKSAGGSGLLNVFLVHATAGLALMETGAGSEDDLETILEDLLPRDDRYVHSHGSVGHGGDHVLPVFISPSLMLQVDNGTVVLGTWQSVVLVDPNRENNRRTIKFALLEGYNA